MNGQQLPLDQPTVTSLHVEARGVAKNRPAQKNLYKRPVLKNRSSQTNPSPLNWIVGCRKLNLSIIHQHPVYGINARRSLNTETLESRICVGKKRPICSPYAHVGLQRYDKVCLLTGLHDNGGNLRTQSIGNRRVEIFYGQPPYHRTWTANLQAKLDKWIVAR